MVNVRFLWSWLETSETYDEEGRLAKRKQERLLPSSPVRITRLQLWPTGMYKLCSSTWCSRSDSLKRRSKRARHHQVPMDFSARFVNCCTEEAAYRVGDRICGFWACFVTHDEIKKRLAKCPLSAVFVWLNVSRLLPLHVCEVPAKENRDNCGILHSRAQNWKLMLFTLSMHSELSNC